MERRVEGDREVKAGCVLFGCPLAEGKDRKINSNVKKGRERGNMTPANFETSQDGLQEKNRTERDGAKSKKAHFQNYGCQPHPTGTGLNEKSE